MLINNAKCKFVQKNPQKHCTFKLLLKKERHINNIIETGLLANDSDIFIFKLYL